MYKEKYLKYKTKYLELKIQLGGDPNILQEGDVFMVEQKNPPLVFNQPLVITRTTADLTTIINEAFQSKNRYLQIEIGSISKSEFTALINGLTKNTTIKILTLKIKELEPEMYKQLGDAVNKTLQMLVIEILDKNNNRIIVPYELMEVLSTNSNLRAIMFLNTINDDVAIKLLELFTNNNYIYYAMFAANNISKQTKKNIESFLKKKKNVNKKIYLSLDEVPKNGGIGKK